MEGSASRDCPSWEHTGSQVQGVVMRCPQWPCPRTHLASQEGFNPSSGSGQGVQRWGWGFPNVWGTAWAPAHPAESRPSRGGWWCPDPEGPLIHQNTRNLPEGSVCSAYLRGCLTFFFFYRIFEIIIDWQEVAEKGTGKDHVPFTQPSTHEHLV